ncbi:protein containing DUF1592 [Rhodopirellula sallentina SM41]|uniref:Protein containing DUF1592 n=1 Tax=Rhodopirellula sallentina SM41 TaxID=1263870 RepID=M5UF23_9BACT|nr:protein containing DUF1592 [Rhodopirellula sallentina SM41]
MRLQYCPSRSCRLRYQLPWVLVGISLLSVVSGQVFQGQVFQGQCCLLQGSVVAADLAFESNARQPTLSELKTIGAKESAYLEASTPAVDQVVARDASVFAETIKPILESTCVDCHGPYGAEAGFDITAIDPDMVDGGDAEWWQEVLASVSNGEMPPPDEVEMEDEDRASVVDWLSNEIHYASIARRARESNTSFRRLTKYEYNYALQDLLGEPWDFAKDLPPESVSEDGFENSSDSLHLSVSQFETYRQLARRALDRVAVRGERPEIVRWRHSMTDAAAIEQRLHREKVKRLEKRFEDDEEKRKKQIETVTRIHHNPTSGPYYLDVATGEKIRAKWEYNGAKYAIEPIDQQRDEGSDGAEAATGDETSGADDEPISIDALDGNAEKTETLSKFVAVLPAGKRSHLTVELGNQVPDEGFLRVRVHASRPAKQDRVPSMQLVFGWRATNEGRADVRVSKRDTPVTAGAEEPQVYEWLIPLGEIDPRNAERKTSTMGRFPSPSEYIRLVNSSVPNAKAGPADIVIESVEVDAPIYDQWPPESHVRLFPRGTVDASMTDAEELEYAREILSTFMPRAWRGPVTSSAVESKVALFEAIRDGSDDFQDAMLEVMATVLTSPRFLYFAPVPSQASSEHVPRRLSDTDLAVRLSLFLWCSVPDERLLRLAESNELHLPDVLRAEVDRMLADPRHERFIEHFVGQWLDLRSLDYLAVDKSFTDFDPALKEAMQQEPRAFFAEMLRTDASVLDVIHADYATVNERLAVHYGIADVAGNEFQRVPLDDAASRGGVLTQAGLLAMNSDGEHSHPLKRGVWVLKCLLNDPPPPPPAAVPEIDLADPEIAKLTLKQRIEDHRNQAACMSCHKKIDPWGIAFENYDAIGHWRDEIQGQPVDASSALYNDHVLDGIDGLKRYLLDDRQDQFVHAMVEKLAIFALGRPLAFSDSAAVDEVTRTVRRNGDGLKTLVQSLVTSDLFMGP